MVRLVKCATFPRVEVFYIMFLQWCKYCKLSFNFSNMTTNSATVVVSDDIEQSHFVVGETSTSFFNLLLQRLIDQSGYNNETMNFQINIYS